MFNSQCVSCYCHDCLLIKASINLWRDSKGIKEFTDGMSAYSTSTLKVNSQHRVVEDNGERRKLLPWHQHFQFSGLSKCHMDHWRHSSDGLPAISALSQMRMRHPQVPEPLFFSVHSFGCCPIIPSSPSCPDALIGGFQSLLSSPSHLHLNRHPGAQDREILSQIHMFFCLPSEDLVSSWDSGTFPHVPAHCW